jgi:Protein of unknown function (DUF2924)
MVIEESKRLWPSPDHAESILESAKKSLDCPAKQSVTVHTADFSAYGEQVQETLSAQINSLPALSKSQLLIIWAENFSNDPPPKLRKELMVPILAYRIQEKEFGGLSHAARRRLREVAASLMTDKPAQERPDSAPKTGTRLLRMWRGVTHEVIATGSGYEYHGRTYSSLSKIAREITGTQWSGPLFFGVRKK